MPSANFGPDKRGAEIILIVARQIGIHHAMAAIPLAGAGGVRRFDPQGNGKTGASMANGAGNLRVSAAAVELNGLRAADVAGTDKDAAVVGAVIAVAAVVKNVAIQRVIRRG